MASRIFFHLVVGFLAAGSLGARSLEEIRRSGYLNVALREKPTVFERNGSVTNGLHWRMVELLCESLKLRPRAFLVSNLPQYFTRASSGDAALFSQVDLYADNLTITESRQRLVDFVKIYDVVQVCLMGEGIQIRSNADLLRLPASIAEGSTYEELVVDLEKKLGAKMAVVKVPDTTRQVDDLVAGRCAWTILDSDQAFYQASRNRGLTVGLETLKEVSMIRGIGWGFAKSGSSPSALSREVGRFLESPAGRRAFDRVWRETYGISREDYGELISIIDARGEEIIRKALASYMQEDFSAARDQLRLALQARIASAQLLKLYDRIYQRLLEKEFKKARSEPFGILDEYFAQQPTREMVLWLRFTWPGIWSDYLRHLAGRRKELQKSNLLDAIRTQEIVLILDPTEENRSILRLLLLQRAEQGRVASRSNEFKPAVPARAAVDEWRGRKQGALEVAVATLASSPADFVEVPEPEVAPKPNRAEKRSVAEASSAEGERLFQEASLSIRKKAWSEALRPLRSCLVLAYRTEEVKSLIELCLAGLREDEAKVQRARQEEFDAAFRKALEHYFAARNAEAYESIVVCLRLFPDSGPARKYAQLIGDRLRLDSEAKVDELSPYLSYFRTRIVEVDARMAKGEWPQAKAATEEILGLFPRNEDARERLLLCVYNQDPKAFEGLVGSFFDEVMASAKAGDRQRAIRGLRLIKKLKPDFAGVDARLQALEAEDLAELTGAMVTTNRTEGPVFDPKALFEEAKKLEASGDAEGALEKVKELLRKAPRHYEGNLAASRLENEVERKKSETRMVATVQESFRPAPSAAESESWFLKGQFFFRLGDYASTISCWENAVAAAPDNAGLRRQLDRVRKLARY